MSKNEESTTVSQQLDGFLSKNKTALIVIIVAVVVLLAGFICFQTIGSKSVEKNISKIETISYKLVQDAEALGEDADASAVNALIDQAIADLKPFTGKSGISGVRANMLAAELAFQKNDYAAAIGYWNTVSAKSKMTYTAPLANYNMGVCYEQTKDFEKAYEAYKAAADFEEFSMAPHAKFSCGRVLEAMGKTDEAVAAYESITDKYADEDWAKLAKTRIIALTINK